MKSFILSLVIFAILIAGIVINCMYVAKFSDRLEEYANLFPADRMPEGRTEIDGLLKFWKKNEFFIMLTNDHTKVHEVYGHIQNMEASLISGNFTLYTEARLSITEAARNFKEFDTFSLVGVL